MKVHHSSSYPQDINLLTSLSYCQQVSQAHHVAGDDDIMEDVNLDLYCHGIGKFKAAVLGYIAGYVVTMAKWKITCEEWLSALYCSSPDGHSEFFIAF